MVGISGVADVDSKRQGRVRLSIDETIDLAKAVTVGAFKEKLTKDRNVAKIELRQVAENGDDIIIAGAKTYTSTLYVYNDRIVGFSRDTNFIKTENILVGIISKDVVKERNYSVMDERKIL